MASTLEVLAPQGLSLTVDLYPLDSDVIANGAGDALVEATNRKGRYAATISESLSGYHTAHIKLGNTVIAVWYVYMIDGEVCRCADLSILLLGNEPVSSYVPAPPSSEGQIIGIGYVYDEYGALESDVEIHVKMIIAARTSGFYDGAVATYTSVAGIITIPDMFKTATYLIWRSDSDKRMKYYVPDTDEDSVNLPPVLGSDEPDDCN